MYDVVFYAPLAGSLLAGARWQEGAGGAETQVCLVARELARRGLGVALVCFDVTGGLPPQADGITISVRPPWRAARGRLGPLVEAAALVRSVMRLDARTYVQRAAGFETGLVALAAKLRGRRFVHSSASTADFEFASYESSRRNRLLYRLGVALADEFVVQSEEQRELCRERFGFASTPIPSVAEPAPPRVGPGAAFLWVGRAIWYKGPLAYLELARAVPSARFRMVVLQHGGPPGEIDQELDRARAGLPNLELLDALPHEELLTLMDEAVAIVSTSAFEGMPNIFLEGWARGVPALTLNTDPDGVIEREGLGAFAHGSSEALAAKARDLWLRRASQSDVAYRCRSHVARRHSATTVGDRWLSVLQTGRGTVSDMGPRSSGVSSGPPHGTGGGR